MIMKELIVFTIVKISTGDSVTTAPKYKSNRLMSHERNNILK